MKYQVLFSQKNMKRYLEMSSAAVVIDTLRVKLGPGLPSQKKSML